MVRGFRALFRWLYPLSDDESSNGGDMTGVEIVNGGGPDGPGGDANDAVLLAFNSGDAPAVKPTPQKESQALNLDSY